MMTDEMKMELPHISDEELNAIRSSKEELIKNAIKEFNRRADEIDAILDLSPE